MPVALPATQAAQVLQQTARIPADNIMGSQATSRRGARGKEALRGALKTIAGSIVAADPNRLRNYANTLQSQRHSQGRFGSFVAKLEQVSPIPERFIIAGSAPTTAPTRVTLPRLPFPVPDGAPVNLPNLQRNMLSTPPPDSLLGTLLQEPDFWRIVEKFNQTPGVAKGFIDQVDAFKRFTKANATDGVAFAQNLFDDYVSNLRLKRPKRLTSPLKSFLRSEQFDNDFRSSDFNNPIQFIRRGNYYELSNSSFDLVPDLDPNSVDVQNPFPIFFTISDAPGETLEANSYITLSGRDRGVVDGDGKIFKNEEQNRRYYGRFTNIFTLRLEDICLILAYSQLLFEKSISRIGLIIDETVGDGSNKNYGLLDFKFVAYAIFGTLYGGLNWQSLIEIDESIDEEIEDKVIYNANEAGNFLWGLALTYSGFRLKPAALATIFSFGDDENHEQRAIVSGVVMGERLKDESRIQETESCISKSRNSVLANLIFTEDIIKRLEGDDFFNATRERIRNLERKIQFFVPRFIITELDK